MNRGVVAVAVVGVVLLAACASLPKPGKPALPDYQFRMREFRLENGLRVIVEEDHSAPLVGVFTLVGAGSSSDPQGKEGLAHFIEHLQFRAQPYRRGTVWNQLQKAGVGYLNAQTSLDFTLYEEVGSKELLPTLLTLESGRILTPLVGVEPAVFEVEREVVRNELRQRGENAIGPAFAYLQEAVFPPGHPYARPGVGTHDSLSGITMDDAKQFVAANYVPKNMTLLIVGDVELDGIEQTLQRALPSKLFQPVPIGKEPFPSRLHTPVEPPEPPATKLLRKHSTVASPELYVVWSLPRSFDSETVLLDFVRAAAARELSGSFYSDPDIVNVAVHGIPGVAASMLVAQVTLHKGEHVEQSYERVLDQLVKLWASGEAGRALSGDTTHTAFAAEVDFMHKRNAALMRMTFEGEAILVRGMERVSATHFSGDPLVYTRRLHALAEVSPGQVTHFAERYLTRDRARAVLVEPYPPNAKEAEPGVTGLAPASADAVVDGFTAEGIKQLGHAEAERGKFETVVKAVPTHLDEVLPNGLRVVVHRREKSLPLAALELVLPVGYAGTTPVGGALALQLARPRSHVYGRPREFGIDLSTDISFDRTVIAATGASGNVGNMVAQLSELLASDHVEDGTMGFFQREMVGYVEQREALPMARAERALMQALFAGHPYAETPVMAAAKKLSASDLDGWLKRAFSPTGAVLVVTGDLDTEKVMAQVKEYLGGWTAPKDAFARVPAPTLGTGSTGVVVTEQPNATQAQVHVACLADGGSLTGELTGDTLAKLLSDELFNTIRGQLGASYGFHGRASQLLGGRARLEWSGSIENARLAQALGVMRGLFEGFDDKVLTDAKLSRARWDVARGATLDAANTPTLASVMAHEVLMGRDPKDLASRFEALGGVGPAQVKALWGQCRGSMVMSLVGDEAQIRPALKQAGFSKD